MSHLLEAEKLAADPRIAQAKKLLLEALQDHQKQLTAPRPPLPELKEHYAQLLKTIATVRGAKLWFPFLGSGFGKGSLVELLDGSVKYDFICGIGPHYFGHNHPLITSASIDAALSDTIMQGNLQQNGDSLELSLELCKLSGMPHCFLSTSGAMTNENALKVAFQKHHPAERILAFENCFVGRSLVTGQITDKPYYREGMPITAKVDYIPFYDANRPEESTAAAVNTLKRFLKRYPKEYAVMIFELVQGEGGIVPGTRDFFSALMKILKEANVAIFDDEVQCFGRLPQLFAFQYFGLEKYIDIVSIGKLSQVCATLFTEEICPRPGLLSQTFTGSTSAIRASKAILKELTSNNYFGPKGRIQQLHDYLMSKLGAIAKRNPQLMSEPVGLGCMVAFVPYDGDNARVTHFVHALFEAGVMTFIAGLHPTRCRLLVPAGIVSLEEIDAVCEIIEATLIKEDKPCT